MFGRTVVAVGLVFVVAGCGAQELKSPECDQGKPVVASGQIKLGESVSSGDVTGVKIYLRTVENDQGRTVSVASLEEPGDFPVPFTLCADLSTLGAEGWINTAVVLERPRAMGNLFSVQNHPFDGGRVDNVQHTVGGDVWGGIPLDPCDGSGC